MPRYNTLLRDDKSFPFIHLTADQDFPQITKFRGERDNGGSYFGPFASAGAVNRTLITLQKAFLLRSCSDNIFNNRTRPCLLFQIKRCSAPGVGRVGREDYRRLIDEAHAFLAGRSRDVQQRLAGEMESAAEALDFEAAAMIRDRIRALSLVQGHQDIHIPGIVDADVIPPSGWRAEPCRYFLPRRAGWGNRAISPPRPAIAGRRHQLTAFVGQFYDTGQSHLILLSHQLIEQELVEEALSIGGPHVTLAVPQRGDKKKLADRAYRQRAWGTRPTSRGSASQRQLLDGCRAQPAEAKRIEVYDGSHIQGSNAVGAMIVAGLTN